MSFSGIETYAARLQPILRRILIALVLANALAIGLRTVSDSDTGWHLATGRYVWQQRAIPRTDVLSYTSQGVPWVYPPFGGVLLYLVYAVSGYAGLSWFSAMVCLGIAVYLLRKRDMISCVLTLLALPAIAYRTAPRADLFSTVFFALFLGELWDVHSGVERRLWLLPAIMLVWVNVHPGFIAGLAVIGAYLLLEAADLLSPGRRSSVMERLRQVYPWLFATCIATLINPWGFRIYPAALNLSGLTASPSGSLNSSQYIQEFWGLRITWQTFIQLFDFRHLESGNSWLLVFSVLLFVLALVYRDFAGAAIVGTATYACVSHVRFLAMFAITIVTIGGSLFNRALHAQDSDSRSSEVPPLWHPPVTLTVALVAIVSLLACMHVVDYVSNRSYVLFQAPFRFGAGESNWFPERAASFIERERSPGNILEEFALGGFAAIRLGPTYRNFIDGRADHLNPELFREEQNLMRSGPGSPAWQSAVDRWQINMLLVSTAGARALNGLNVQAFCHDPSWRAVYMDEVSLVFLRNVPTNRSWLDHDSVDCDSYRLTPPNTSSRIVVYDFHLNAAGLLYALHRDDEAAAEARLAESSFPQDPNAHFLLAKVLHRQKDLRGAEQEYRQGLSLNEDTGAWFDFGILLFEQKRYDEAEGALERSIRLSLQPLVPYMALARLELIRGKPNNALATLEKAEKSSPYRGGGESAAPELYAQIAEGRAQAYDMLGDRANSIEQEQRAVSLTPWNAARWNTLADLLQTSGQWQAAIQARAKAGELAANGNQH